MLFFISYAAWSVWSYGDTFEMEKTDAVIVLGAAAWHKDPSPVLRERINQAISLYEDGYTETIIFTGGKGEGAPFAESEVSKEYAIEQNVPEGDILVETDSQMTEGNLRNALELGKKHDLHSFSIVSDPLHMKRAMLLAKDLGMEAYATPTQTSAYRSWRSKLPFFLRELAFYSAYLIMWPISKILELSPAELVNQFF